MTTTFECARCSSLDIVKNGRTQTGKQKYHCHECGAYGTLEAEVKYPPERQEEILRAYHERSSLRGLERPLVWPAKRYLNGQKKPINYPL